ncbi:hypothetical protein IKS_03676 [Bacillus cereus VDM062]|nr:hypothetical protein IKS_03676 [Bacillus cereus VDM062]
MRERMRATTERVMRRHEREKKKKEATRRKKKKTEKENKKKENINSYDIWMIETLKKSREEIERGHDTLGYLRKKRSCWGEPIYRGHPINSASDPESFTTLLSKFYSYFKQVCLIY